MTLWLENRAAIVTGSGQGIGKAVAVALAKEGAKVVTNNRRPGTPGGDAETTAREIIDIGGQAVPFFGDVSKFEIAQKLIQTAVDNFGRLDILVNNAGIGRNKAFVDTTEDDFDELVAVNLKGQFCCLKAVLPHMIAQKYGRIINISSMAVTGVKGQVIYGTTKAGILGLTNGLAQEVKEDGITVNTVMPAASSRMLSQVQDAIAAGIVKLPLSAVAGGPPENNAPLVTYLASERAGKITGRTFTLDWEGNVQLVSTPMVVRSAHREEWTVEDVDEVMPQLVPEIG